jgi:hypothetical protein
VIVAPVWVFLILFAIAGAVWVYKAIAVKPKERALHEQQKNQLYRNPPPTESDGESRPGWD